MVPFTKGAWAIGAEQNTYGRFCLDALPKKGMDILSAILCLIVFESSFSQTDMGAKNKTIKKVVKAKINNQSRSQPAQHNPLGQNVFF